MEIEVYCLLYQLNAQSSFSLKMVVHLYGNMLEMCLKYLCS